MEKTEIKEMKEIVDGLFKAMNTHGNVLGPWLLDDVYKVLAFANEQLEKLEELSS